MNIMILRLILSQWRMNIGKNSKHKIKWVSGERMGEKEEMGDYYLCEEDRSSFSINN